jgi:hypothetical protein
MDTSPVDVPGDVGRMYVVLVDASISLPLGDPSTVVSRIGCAITGKRDIETGIKTGKASTAPKLNSANIRKCVLRFDTDSGLHT